MLRALLALAGLSLVACHDDSTTYYCSPQVGPLTAAEYAVYRDAGIVDASLCPAGTECTGVSCQGFGGCRPFSVVCGADAGGGGFATGASSGGSTSRASGSGS